MLQPSTLGIFSAFVLVFHEVFGTDRTLRRLLAIAVPAIVFFTASGTALLLLAVAFAWMALRRRAVSRPQALGLALGAVAFFTVLPQITGRPDVFASIWGRFDAFLELMRNQPAARLLLGHGLGAGTNASANLMAWSSSGWRRAAAGPRLVLPTDSTPAVMLAEMGALGLVILYGTMSVAAARDPAARPLYVYLGVASLAVSVTETFPLNIVLGLLLARTLGQRCQLLPPPDPVKVKTTPNAIP
jgi:hypothetical protein